MKLYCVWEHNGSDSLLFIENLPGAFTRGTSKTEAVNKLPTEAEDWLRWAGKAVPKSFQIEVVQEIASDVDVRDGDSNVLFQSEKAPLGEEEYLFLRDLALRSAKDFWTLYQGVPDKGKTCLQVRKTFYGNIPRTAEEMYQHTKNVNDYYFSEIGIGAGSEGTILQCRERGFAMLEERPEYLANSLYLGSYDEEWTLRKVMRRFLWHDRIHAKALMRMAYKTFGAQAVPNVYMFSKQQLFSKAEKKFQ